MKHSATDTVVGEIARIKSQLTQDDREIDILAGEGFHVGGSGVWRAPGTTFIHRGPLEENIQNYEELVLISSKWVRMCDILTE